METQHVVCNKKGFLGQKAGLFEGVSNSGTTHPLAMLHSFSYPVSLPYSEMY